MHYGRHSPEASEREGERRKAGQDLAMRAYPQLCHSGEVGSSVSLARRGIVEVLVSSLLCCLAATDSWTLFVSPTANRRICDFFDALHLGRRSALHTTLYRTVPPTAQAPTPLLLMLPHFCCYCARCQPLGPPPPRATLRKQTIVYKIAVFRALKTNKQTSPEGNPLPVGKGNTFFTYDRIFDEDSSTREVYEGVAQEIVHSVVRGLNGTIFAYGQTSSGKTFTMQGDGENTETPGIVQMAARDLFDLMGEAPNRVFLMRVSYLEIYQEEIRDLLNPESTQRLQVGARESGVGY